MRPEINWDSVFQNINNITGLPLHFSRGKWYGSCYIDGTPHNRQDKTVAYMTENGIRILEQGGDNISLLAWMIKFGDCKNWAEAYSRLRADTGSTVIHQLPERKWIELPLRYVDSVEVGRRNGQCNLFEFLASKFGHERVCEIWDKYHVGSKALRSGEIATVFWYLDSYGRCCHDKVMLYRKDGHRDKEYGGGRKYKVGDGYRGRTYFGSHLLGEHKGRIALLESEKSALIASLAYPETLWLATGGGSMLREVKKNFLLYPDFDTCGLTWIDRYPSQCVKWWERYPDVEKGMDIADIILRKYDK